MYALILYAVYWLRAAVKSQFSVFIGQKSTLLAAIIINEMGNFACVDAHIYTLTLSRRLKMSTLKVLSAFILFSCFLAVAAVDVTCPLEGVRLGCKCKNQFGFYHVQCKNIDTIKDIPPWLPEYTRVLELENCDIRLLSKESFKNLANLTTLAITDQQRWVTFSDGLVFQGLRYLKNVFLDNNYIVSLPSGLFANLPNLRHVALNNNPLQTLPDDLFENSTTVRSLEIKKTEFDRSIIVKIASGHFGKNINELFMSGTIIQFLTNDFFIGLPKLRTLEIVSCGILYVGNDILKGTDVTSFHLDKNPVKDIHKNAFRGSKVRAFSCYGCQLTSKVLFNGFLKKMDLHSLFLTNNNIASIPQNAFTGLNNLDTLHLRGNPLVCDCDLVWLRSFADHIKFSDKFSWKCALPRKVSGKSLTSLTESEMCDT